MSLSTSEDERFVVDVTVCVEGKNSDLPQIAL